MRFLMASIDVLLTERQKQIVDLYYIDQKNIVEISNVLEVNKSTVQRTLKRAVKKLILAKNIFEKSCTL